MASIFKRPRRVAQLGRNGFDMSQRHTFSCPVGMLLPTYTDFANPGDKYKLNSRAFIRTQPLESAAFLRMKAHLDWFFVPITQIYSLWNEFYNMTNDVMSSIYTAAPKSTLPLAPLAPLATPFGSLGFTQRIAGQTALSVDEFGVPLAWNARRLLTMLYGAQIFGETQPQDTSSFLSLCAYHKIFHSHYRNTDYTSNNPDSYSLDRWYSTTPDLPTLSQAGFFKIHYRPFRRDMYTMIQPAPVFGNAFESFLSGSLADPSSAVESFFPEASANNFVKVYNPTQFSSSGSSFNSGIKTPALNIHYSSSQGFFSAGDIRAMFALDKLFRITAQTGSHYDEQTLAHFGYKMPQGIADEAYYLGEQVTDININEVVATATTGVKEAGGVIGDIAGKGFGYTNNSDDINFTCPCHGIIMAIWSIEPIPDYRNTGDVTANYRNSFDFYHPEFDNIGMQPYGFAPNFISSNIPGWQYRYMQHKTKLDIVDESVYGTSLNSWQATRDDIYSHGSADDLRDIPLSARFYIYPQYTNSIFLLNMPTYSGSNYTDILIPAESPQDWSNPLLLPTKIYSYDNFICVVEHKAFKTSCMSTYSLPKM
ncbi:major capsid protein [Microvirus mar61]|uniref:Major capsid protein n=1 Tax=Microvirus mar61 TaxID=2851198 RepID=A0A8F5RCT1_9VIRU|nr:major capsid protein [Microvirus mar61]